MSKLELKQLELANAFSLHSFIALLFLGRSRIPVLCIHTCILIFGLIDVHRLALALSARRKEPRATVPDLSRASLWIGSTGALFTSTVVFVLGGAFGGPAVVPRAP